MTMAGAVKWPFRNRYCIVGVGNTAYGKLPGWSHVALNVEAIKRALDDAGLNKDDVDGVLTKAPTSDFQMLYSARVAQALGISPGVTATIDQAGASNIGLIWYAMSVIDAGMAEVVVCSYGDNPLTGSRAAYRRIAGDEAAYGLMGAPAGYALITRRYMAEFGLKPEQLAAVAIACRKHAALNPNAQFRDPITLEDYFNSRFVVEPLRLYDCCPITDGGAAVVVTTEERARDLKKPPVHILGVGQSHPAKDLVLRENWTTSGAKESGRVAFEMAGITPQDVDVVQLYDCFTIVPIITLEDYGFCKKGEGGAFVEGGRIELGGELPLNTSGGLLAETGMPGMQLIIEAVRQLRGECGPRQVPGAKIAVVSNQGGIMTTHATLVLGREK
jgi:acetyl-CoA acetyltransferase